MSEQEEFLDKLIQKFDGESNGLTAEEYARLHDLKGELRLMQSVEKAVDSTEIDPLAMARGRAVLMAHIKELDPVKQLSEQRASQQETTWLSLWSGIKDRARGFDPVFTGGLACAMAVAVIFTGIVVGSQGAVPGSGLYPAKLAIESVQLRLSASREDEASLYLQLAEKRLGEAEQLASVREYSFIEPTLERFEQNLDKGLKLAEGVDKDTKDVLNDQAEELAKKQDSLVRSVIAQAEPEVKQDLTTYLEGAGPGAGAATSTSEPGDEPSVTKVGGESEPGDLQGSNNDDIVNSTTTSIVSVASAVEPKVTSIELSTSLLSPNNDGRFEFLSIEVKGDPDQALCLMIVNEQGMTILKDAALNVISASGEHYGYEWNGKTSEGDYAPDGDYFVVITSGSGVMASERREFTIDTDEPATPLAVSPVNGAVVSSDALVISWRSVDDAERYLLEYSTGTSSSAGSIMSIFTSSTSQTLDLTSVNGPATIYWRVYAEDAAGNRSNASPERQFQIVP